MLYREGSLRFFYDRGATRGRGRGRWQHLPHGDRRLGGNYDLKKRGKTEGRKETGNVQKRKTKSEIIAKGEFVETVKHTEANLIDLTARPIGTISLRFGRDDDTLRQPIIGLFAPPF